MSKSVKLSDDLLIEAERYSRLYSRSIPKQIEHWAKIGKIAEDNSDLSYQFIMDILFALDEVKEGKETEYKFG